MFIFSSLRLLMFFVSLFIIQRVFGWYKTCSPFYVPLIQAHLFINEAHLAHIPITVGVWVIYPVGSTPFRRAPATRRRYITMLGDPSSYSVDLNIYR